MIQKYGLVYNEDYNKAWAEDSLHNTIRESHQLMGAPDNIDTNYYIIPVDPLCSSL